MKKFMKITGIVMNIIVFLTAVMAICIWWPWFTDHLYWGWELDLDSMLVGVISHLVVIYAIFTNVVKLVERHDQKIIENELK